MWYTRKETGLRVSYLLVCAVLAGGTGGLLSYAIGKVDGVAGMHGWRWILIMEGLPSVVLGVVALFLLPNDPETAYFLNAEDQLMVQARRAAEYGQTVSAQ
jgi:MFS family permease